MAVAQALEQGQYRSGLHRMLELGGNIDCPWRFIFPDFDLYRVTDFRSNLTAYRFENTEHMPRISIFHKRAGIRDTIEGSLDRHFAFRSKLFLDVVGEKHVCSAPVTLLDRGCKFVLFHPVDSLTDFGGADVLRTLSWTELPELLVGKVTTLAAAEVTERVCYGIELDPKYVDVVVQRWQQLTGKQATLDGNGRTFEAVADERQRMAA